jgi:hypothetical protein
MRALAGAGVFGLVPHPSTAVLDAPGINACDVGSPRAELEARRLDHPRYVTERMATPEELARIRRELSEIYLGESSGCGSSRD